MYKIIYLFFAFVLRNSYDKVVQYYTCINFELITYGLYLSIIKISRQ